MFWHRWERCNGGINKLTNAWIIKVITLITTVNVVYFLPLVIMTSVYLPVQVNAATPTESSTLPKNDYPSLSLSTSSRFADIFFPFTSPAINAVLATTYISVPPNLLLALCPPNVNRRALGVFVAFAVGGLLGDTLFHLIPEIFNLDTPQSFPSHNFPSVSDVNHDFTPKSNHALHATTTAILEYQKRMKPLLLGVFIFTGFLAFFCVDKLLRIALNNGHLSHAHAHDDIVPSSELTVQVRDNSTAIAPDSTAGVRARKKKASATPTVPTTVSVPQTSIQQPNTASYLNMLADFTHNITDGLALASSFYASPALGATTTLAIFFHEIPHEVGDFALLIRSGLGKRCALLAQFATAIGAYLGTFIGILVQRAGENEATATFSSSPLPTAVNPVTLYLNRAGIAWSDILLPMSTGSFIYLATVITAPELLEASPSPPCVFRDLKLFIAQLFAISAGAAVMFWISFV